MQGMRLQWTAEMTEMLSRILLSLACMLTASSLRAMPSPIELAAEAILQSHANAPILVVGEMHGTAEAPVVIAELAARILDTSGLTVGLEIPAQEQARLDAYLVSDGSVAAQGALLEGAF
jgi:hypothetical protein